MPLIPSCLVCLASYLAAASIFFYLASNYVDRSILVNN
jgi:hypothetical protein